MWSRVALASVVLLFAGCTSLTDGITLFSVDAVDNGLSIYDAHVDAVDAVDVMYWGAGVIISEDGKVMGSHSSLVWGNDESSHATSVNGLQYFDNSDLFRQQDVEIPEGTTVTPPATLGKINISSLRNIGGEGRITVTFLSACVPQSGDDAGYEVTGSGNKKGAFECEEGDWSAVVVEDPQGPNAGQAHTIILRA